jgi:hypothetical protein
MKVYSLYPYLFSPPLVFPSRVYFQLLCSDFDVCFPYLSSILSGFRFPLTVNTRCVSLLNFISFQAFSYPSAHLRFFSSQIVLHFLVLEPVIFLHLALLSFHILHLSPPYFMLLCILLDLNVIPFI